MRMSAEVTASHSDADLVARYRASRSREDFAQIVARHGAMVLRTCQRITNNRQDAEDAAQAVFLVLAQQPQTVRQNLAGWLHTVARHAAARLLRSQARRARREEVIARMKPSSSSPDLGELREELDWALSRLPIRLREAVVLRYLEGRDSREAAAAAGCSEETIRWRSMKGLHRLRGILARREVVCSLATLTALLQHEAQAAAAVTPWALWNLCGATGASTGGQAAAVAQSVAQTLAWGRLKLHAAFAAVGLLLLGAGTPVLMRALDGGPASPALLSAPAMDANEAADPLRRFVAALDRDLAAVLPRPAEERFREVPWRMDFAAARVEANRDRKPIFLWLMDGHPLATPCINGQVGRATVFADPEVITLLRDDFVPVAAHTAHLAPQERRQRGWCESSRFLERLIVQSGLRRQDPSETAQGYYAFSAAGDYYGAHNEPKQVRALLEQAKRAAAQSPPRPVALTETSLGSPLRQWYRAVVPQSEQAKGLVANPDMPLPPGTSVLWVYSRIDPLPALADLNPLNQRFGSDLLWVQQSEVEEMVRRLETATEAPAPETLARRLVRFGLSDNVRGTADPWRPKDIQQASFRIQRLATTSTTLTVGWSGSFSLRMTGVRVRWQPQIREAGYSGQLRGLMEIDRSTLALKGVRLLAQGEAYGATTNTHGPPPGKFPLKVALVLAEDVLARQIAPRSFMYVTEAEYLKPR
jgi:RNA polymerase sigma factor (sigma-70 family)